jgi:hypothetical protein
MRRLYGGHAGDESLDAALEVAADDGRTAAAAGSADVAGAPAGATAAALKGLEDAPCRTTEQVARRARTS